MLNPFLTEEDLFGPAHLQETLKIVHEKHANSKGVSALTKIMGSEEQIEAIFKPCKTANYDFNPYGLKLVLKGRGKVPREISVPSIIDKVVLKTLHDSLKVTCPIRNQTQLASFVIKDISLFLETVGHETCVMRLDIQKFFNSIDHAILTRKLKRKNCPDWVVRLVTKAISTPSKEKGAKTPPKTTEGIPQGLPIASYLADIYLEAFDAKLAGICIKSYRYVDDILIFYSKQDERTVQQFIECEMHALQLKIHTENYSGKFFKGSVFNEKGFDYLGYHFKRSNKGTLISVKDSGIQRFLNSVIGIISTYKKGGYELKYGGNSRRAMKNFEFDLNEKITGAFKEDKRYGWLWYYRQMNDWALLERIDRIITKELKKDDKTRNSKVKKLKRTYYEIKHFSAKKTYILNYGLTNPETIKQHYGELDKDIERAALDKTLAAFNNFTSKRLKKLALDEVRES